MASAPPPYAPLLDALDQGALLADARGVLHLNGTLKQMLGYAPEDPPPSLNLGELLHRHFKPFEAQAILSELDQARNGGPEQGRAERHLQTLRGEELVVSAHVSAFGPTNARMGLLTLRDVSAEGQMRLRLEQSDRLSSLGTLASGLAHEINNPLAYLTSNLAFSIEQLNRVRVDASTSMTPEGRETHAALLEVLEALEEAGNGVDRVARIVHGLGAFSQGHDEEIRSIDVHGALDIAAAMTEGRLKERAKIVKRYGAVPPVLGSESRLVQILVSLLVNALQAIPPGKPDDNEVTLRTERDPGGRISVEVSDTGSGIPEHLLPRIFDPFFTTKPIGVGTGLGLAICHGLVRSLGGELTVKSEWGKGSTFCLHLRPAETPRSTAPPPPGRVRVLIVDDEPLILRSLRRPLAVENEVTALGSAAEALSAIRGGAEFDLILCDVMMPGTSGMEFHSELQKHHPELARRVVFLTGASMDHDIEQYVEVHGNPLLSKPVHVKTLQGLVRQVCT